MLVLSLNLGIYAQSDVSAHTPGVRKTTYATETELDLDVKQFKFEELQARLSVLPNGPERDYFSGILANRTGHTESSISLLKDAIPLIEANRPYRLKEGLFALIDDYGKLYQYADAFKTYQELARYFPGKEKEDDYRTLKLLRTVPPQTISWLGPTRLKTEHSPLGSIDVNLTVNGVTGPWILDTGANHSVISSSFAKRLGVRPLMGESLEQGGTNGLESRIRAGVLPVLKVGGATLHNVVVLIFDDEDLKINHYQIQAILGFPVFQALGKVTFTHDGYFKAGTTANQIEPVARIYMNRLEPLINCEFDNKKLLFSFDTGADGSTFSIRYYREFSSQFRNLKTVDNTTSGAGGTAKRDVYVLPKVVLKIAGKDVMLHDVTVFPLLLGTDVDQNYGNLGRDVVGGFDSFTLDFINMTFGLGRRLNLQVKPLN